MTHRTYTGDIDEFQLSPDGKKAAFIVHGDVFADLADKGEKVKKGGDSFKVTDTPARESQLRWHPESNRVVYVSDRFGNNQIFQYDFLARERRNSPIRPSRNTPRIFRRMVERSRTCKATPKFG